MKTPEIFSRLFLSLSVNIIIKDGYTLGKIAKYIYKKNTNCLLIKLHVDKEYYN